MHEDVAYELVDTPAGLAAAARALDAGRGPFAIDTERASAFRYEDRAFLVQIYRRGAGTFLFTPEGHRDELTAALAPVVNRGEWILHAASEDLAALALLGLHPAGLFDTELAARLAGFERPNLGAMVAHFTGVELEKGHGQEDWSETPLPPEWLEYAALDVAYLNELAEALAEKLDSQGLLGAAEQEFAHLIATRSLAAPRAKTWRDLKGLSTVRSPAGLQVARELWTARDQRARAKDESPSRVLPSRVLLEIAETRPRSERELARMHGFPARRKGATEYWFSRLQRALDAPADTWPSPIPRDPLVPPSKRNWERNHPQSWAVLARARELCAAAAAQLGVRTEDLLSPAVLREAIWKAALELELDDAPSWPLAPRSTGFAARELKAAGARDWQVEITAPLVARAAREAGAV